MIRKRGVWAGLLLGVAACGPPDMVPVAPPGMEFQPVMVEKDETPAEALGEARTTTALIPSAGTSITPVVAAEPTAPGQPKTLENKLTYETLAAGDGVAAESGKRVSVEYTGTLEDGTVFDSSKDSGRPFEFVIGAGGVIKGWDLGVAGMKTGETRKLTIPPDLAYGANPPTPKIPANATLVFEIKLLKVE